MASNEELFAAENVLKTLGNYSATFQDYSNLSMVNRKAQIALADGAAKHRQYATDADYFRKSGTGKRDALAEAQARRALIDYGWNFESWESLSLDRRRSSGVRSGQTPDGILTRSDGSIAVVDFFNCATAMPANKTVGKDASLVEVQVAIKANSSAWPILRNAEKKYKKYASVEARIAIVNISDFPRTTPTDFIKRLVLVERNQQTNSPSSSAGAELWAVRGLLLSRFF